MKTVPLPALIVVLLLAASSHASAATLLGTPFVGASVDGVCFVTNMSRKPIVVSGRLLDQVGGTLPLAVDTCSSAPLEPGATCAVGAVTASLPAGATYRGFACAITSTSNKVRAIAYGSNPPGGLQPIVPATK